MTFKVIQIFQVIVNGAIR